MKRKLLHAQPTLKTMIRLLNMSDYDAWIELAREVEPLFGPMADSPDLQT